MPETLNSELDSAELEHAAYLLAGKYRDEGDLAAAARWYRTAAARDFPDASLELAKVLDRLAHGDQPAGRRGARSAAEPPFCPRGGLAQVMAWQLTAATVHVGTCRPCQNELLSYGGIVPAAHRGSRTSPHSRPPGTCLAGRG